MFFNYAFILRRYLFIIIESIVIMDDFYNEDFYFLILKTGAILSL